MDAGSFGKFTDSHHSLTRAIVIMRSVLRYKVKRKRLGGRRLQAAVIDTPSSIHGVSDHYLLSDQRRD